MEFSILIQILVSVTFFLLVIGTSILTVHFCEKNTRLAIVVFIVGNLITILLARVCNKSAEIIVCYPDGHHKRSEWLYSFCDSGGNRYPIARRKTCVFYDGMGRENIPQFCDLTVFPVVYTTVTSKVGKLVGGNAPSAVQMSIPLHSLQEIQHTIHYAFKRIPSEQDTCDICENEETIWSIDYTDNVGVDYVPYYRRLVYVCPDTY